MHRFWHFSSTTNHCHDSVPAMPILLRHAWRNLISTPRMLNPTDLFPIYRCCRRCWSACLLNSFCHISTNINCYLTYGLRSAYISGTDQQYTGGTFRHLDSCDRQWRSGDIRPTWSIGCMLLILSIRGSCCVDSRSPMVLAVSYYNGLSRIPGSPYPVCLL